MTAVHWSTSTDFIACGRNSWHATTEVGDVTCGHCLRSMPRILEAESEAQFRREQLLTIRDADLGEALDAITEPDTAVGRMLIGTLWAFAQMIIDRRTEAGAA